MLGPPGLCPSYLGESGMVSEQVSLCMNKAKALILQISFSINAYLLTATHFLPQPPVNCKTFLYLFIPGIPAPKGNLRVDRCAMPYVGEN